MRTLLVTTFLNGKLVLLPNYDSQAALELLAQEEITNLYLVPTLYYDLANHPQLDQYDLRALTRLGYAGDKLWRHLLFQQIASLTVEELDQFALANLQLARFKRPRRYVFIKEVPKSAVGKILRRKLQAGEYKLFDMPVQQ